MRTSILSRSAIAVATLAIGSAALVAAPATAATSNGVTREEVLAAAAAVRADAASEATSDSTQAKLAALAAKVCGPTVDDRFNVFGQPVSTPDSVDGLTITVIQPTGMPEETPPFPSPFLGIDSCTFVAVAPIGGATTFAGDLSVSTATLDPFAGPFGPGQSTSDNVYALSGDVFSSPPMKVTHSVNFSAMAAEGLVTSENGQRVLTVSKIADKKSKAAKKAAKARYVKRTKAAKKTYARALKRAGSNRAAKDAARMTYLSRRASLKSAYAYAIADYKLVKTRSRQADARRFSVSTGSPLGG
jgi:hypothetical protein